MGHILPKRKNAPPNLLYVVQCTTNYQKINKKYWGKIDSFLPQTQKLKWTLRPSFCTQVKSSCVLWYFFIRSFDFGTKQELSPKKFMPRFGQYQKSALLNLRSPEQCFGPCIIRTQIFLNTADFCMSILEISVLPFLLAN